MRRRTVIAGVLGATAAAIGGWLALRNPGPRAPAPASRGEELARLYCQSCHLFSEPALLDKASWTNGVLPEMARWLGLTPPELERTPDGQPVADSNVFPPTPLMSRADWSDLVNYYAQAAPGKLAQGPRPAIEPDTMQFRAKELPYRRGTPMTLMVKIDPVARRLYVGDAMTHTLEALDAAGNRIFAVEFDSGPIWVDPHPGPHPSSHPDGRMGEGLYVTLVGRLFPSDLTRGKLLRLRPDSDGMQIDTLLRNLRRPVHAAGADLNGDNWRDFVVSEFGNRKGKLSWFEGRADGSFEEHILLDRPGAIRVEARDMTADGRPDIVALMGQGREGVYLFINEGGGRFAQKTILEQHPAWGYSYFELIDFDKDGDLDLLTTNGDNGESYGASPAPAKPYHGIRLYLNSGKNEFLERWFFALHGAYGARAMDFDLDGDVDVAAISYFPDYGNSPREAFVYLENEGVKFRAATIPQHGDGRWMTIDAGDLDGDGDADIVIGSLVLGPASIPIPPAIQQRWGANAPAVLVLENLAR